MEGESNKRICRELDIAESTVKNQISAILKALGATNRTQAVLAAGKLRLAPAVRSARTRRRPRTLGGAIDRAPPAAGNSWVSSARN